MIRRCLCGAYGRALGLVLAVVLMPAPATAGSRTPFAVDVAPELTLTAAGLVVYGFLAGFVEPGTPNVLPCRSLDGVKRCDPALLRPMDRRTVAYNSAGWGRLSDVGEGVGIAGGAVAVLATAWAQSSGRPLSDTGQDLLVWAEAFTAANAASQVLKYAVRRPRPALYRADGARGGESLLSFPSGHTLATAASMSAWASIYGLRAPHSPWRWLPMGAGAALTGVVAYGRVLAGKHFVSDVLAGAALGGAVGWALPRLHRRAPTLSLDVALGRDGLRFGIEGRL